MFLLRWPQGKKIIPTTSTRQILHVSDWESFSKLGIGSSVGFSPSATEINRQHTLTWPCPTIWSSVLKIKIILCSLAGNFKVQIRKACQDRLGWSLFLRNINKVILFGKGSNQEKNLILYKLWQLAISVLSALNFWYYLLHSKTSVLTFPSPKPKSHIYHQASVRIISRWKKKP